MGDYKDYQPAHIYLLLFWRDYNIVARYLASQKGQISVRQTRRQSNRVRQKSTNKKTKVKTKEQNKRQDE